MKILLSSGILKGSQESHLLKVEWALDSSSLFPSTDKNLILNTKVHNMLVSTFIQMQENGNIEHIKSTLSTK